MGEKKKGVSLPRFFLIIGFFSALIGVALGAFGAHGLRTRLSPDMLAIFETAVRYQMYHAFGLFAVAWVAVQFPQSQAYVAGWLFMGGTVLFSGSLYVLSLTGVRWWGAVTPFGGVLFLIGWLWLAWNVWRSG